MSSYAFSFFFFYLALVSVLIWLWILVARAVASAAFRKNRSYHSFFWLTFLVGPVLMSLVVAVLPFDSGDPRSPENIRAINPGLAEMQSSALGNKAMNRGFQLVTAGLVGLGVLVAAIVLIAEASAVLAPSSSTQEGDSSVALSGQARELVTALEENCTDEPGPLSAVAAKDGKAGHYLVTGDDGVSGTFYMLDKGNGFIGILADSSDDVSGAWVCGSYFTVSK